MARLSAKDKAAYQTRGFLILKDPAVRRIKNDLMRDLKPIALEIIRKTPPVSRHAAGLAKKPFGAIFDWSIRSEKDNAVTRVFYELFPTAFATIGLAGHPFFTRVSRQLGVRHPLPSTLPILRIDRPSEARYLTPAHQDYWYSMLSDRSVTYWFPLLPVTEAMGPLWVVPGSHRAGLLPIKRWTAENPYALKDDVNGSRYLPVFLKEDEVLVFSQYLIHKSGVNRSDRARITIQVRHNDLTDLRVPTTSFTAKHSRFTEQAQQAWLQRSGRAPSGGSRVG